MMSMVFSLPSRFCPELLFSCPQTGACGVKGKGLKSVTSRFGTTQKARRLPFAATCGLCEFSIDGGAWLSLAVGAQLAPVEPCSSGDTAGYALCADRQGHDR